MMSGNELSDEEQDTIVGELAEGMESLDEEEFEALYAKLDSEHQLEVDQSVRDFADGAVGSEHWDSDN